MINSVVQELLKNEIPDFTVAKEVFDEIFSGLSTSLCAASFLSLLASKYESSDITAAAIISANEAIKKNKLPYDKENTVQNISQDANNYFDFSLTNDVICSACGLCTCDYSFLNPLFLENKFRILSKLGLNFEKKELDYERENCVLKILGENEPYFKYSKEIKMNLKFKTVLDITNILLNPFDAKNLYLGIDNKENVEKFASTALKLNYSNSIIVSGENNLPCVTPFGNSIVAEAWKNKIFTYEITPELLDLKECDENDIKIENDEEYIALFNELLNNNAPPGLFEGAVINAAMVLYISKKADSLIEGIDLAKKNIREGKVKEKFEQIKNFYS